MLNIYFSQMCVSTNVHVKLGRFCNCNLCTHGFDNCNSVIAIYSIYLSINYNTITNYFLIIYELSNFDHVDGNRIYDPQANSLAHYPLDYHGTLSSIFVQSFYIENYWFQVTKTIYFHRFYYCFIYKNNHMLWIYYKFHEIFYN